MPFNISDRSELEKLAHYLIEDEDEDEEISENSKQAIAIVKSIFSKLLGSYEGKTEREYKFVNDSILNVPSTHADARQKKADCRSDAGRAQRASADGVRREVLRPVRRRRINQQGFKLQNHELEHILWRLFLDSRNAQKLNLKNLFRVLKKKEKKNAQGMVVEFKISSRG